jgi:hypothetical protein
MYVKRGDQPRYIAVRRDTDLVRARSALTGGLERRSGAEFGNELRLGAFAVERSQLPPGGGTALTLEWEAIKPLSVDSVGLANVQVILVEGEAVGPSQAISPDVGLVGDPIAVTVRQRVDLTAGHSGSEDRASRTDRHETRAIETGREHVRSVAGRERQAARLSQTAGLKFWRHVELHC